MSQVFLSYGDKTSKVSLSAIRKADIVYQQCERGCIHIVKSKYTERDAILDLDGKLECPKNETEAMLSRRV